MVLSVQIIQPLRTQKDLLKIQRFMGGLSIEISLIMREFLKIKGRGSMEIDTETTLKIAAFAYKNNRY